MSDIKHEKLNVLFILSDEHERSAMGVSSTHCVSTLGASNVVTN
jgi:hypothetical protein